MKQNIDIKNLSREEQLELINQLEQLGYSVKKLQKQTILREEASKLGIEDVQISGEFSSAIHQIANHATDNYTERLGMTRDGIAPVWKRYANKNVPEEKMEEYRRIVSGILQVIKPYCSRKWVLSRYDEREERKRRA